MSLFDRIKSLVIQHTTPAQRGRWEHEFKTRFIKAHRKLSQQRRLLKAFTADDPWALLSFFGMNHTTKIYHEPNYSNPTTVDLGLVSTFDAEGNSRNVRTTTTAYVVGGVRKPAAGIQVSPRSVRKAHYAPDGPLGPEDWELGLTVPPVSQGDPEVVTLRGYWATAPDVTDVFFPHRNPLQVGQVKSPSFPPT